MNSLLQVETRSDEQQTEMEALTAEVSKREPELRAALAAEPDPRETSVAGDPEARELAQLTERANAGAIIMAVTEKRNSIGAELELQQHHKLAENQIPISMLACRAAGRRRDHGADERREPAKRRSCNPCLRMAPARSWESTRPVVAQGDSVFPVLATRPDVGGPHSDSSDVPETDSTFDADLLAPERMQASSMYRRVDAARFPEHGFSAADGAQRWPRGTTRLRGLRGRPRDC